MVLKGVWASEYRDCYQVVHYTLYRASGLLIYYNSPQKVHFSQGLLNSLGYASRASGMMMMMMMRIHAPTPLNPIKRVVARLRSRCHSPICAFPKIRGTFLGVRIIRIIVYWGLYWGPLILGNYYIA